MEPLKAYKAAIDTEIAEYSSVLLERWQREYGFEAAQIFDAYLDILSRGGKRLRGALTMWSYQLAGGADEQLIGHVARLVEMTHAYLLVVDDIADGASTRRSGSSAHKLLEAYHQEQSWFGDTAHFGMSQAMNAAIAALHIIMQELSELPVGDSIKLEAMREFNETLVATVAGQIADINNQSIREVKESEVLHMMQLKTANYSFVSPLEIGIIMAGKDFSDYEWLQNWATNIGLAFQIKDDILGMFGKDEITGKSNLDDLREGKVTLLMVRALGHAHQSQKTSLLTVLGKAEPNKEDLESAQSILEATGALAYCQELAQNYGQKAVSSLEAAPSQMKDHVAFLVELSRSIVVRQS